MIQYMIVRAISMLMRLIYVDSCKIKTDSLRTVSYIVFFSFTIKTFLLTLRWHLDATKGQKKLPNGLVYVHSTRSYETQLRGSPAAWPGNRSFVEEVYQFIEMWHSWPVPPRSCKSNINMVVRWVCLKHELASRDKAPFLGVQWPWHLLLGNLKSPWVTHI